MYTQVCVWVSIAPLTCVYIMYACVWTCRPCSAHGPTCTGSAVCTHIHACICTRVLLCSYVLVCGGPCCVHVCICILLCKHVCIWTLLYPCMCVHVCCNPVVCTSMYARACYVCMYICMGVAAHAQVPPSSRIAHSSPTPSWGTSTQIPAVPGTPQEEFSGANLLPFHSPTYSLSLPGLKK